MIVNAFKHNTIHLKKKTYSNHNNTINGRFLGTGVQTFSQVLFGLRYKMDKDLF